MIIIDGGITAPKGFKATGRHIGIKKRKKDIALILSETGAIAAGSYTKNLVRAAPILWNEKITSTDTNVYGIVVISGNANACTGARGIRDNEKIAEIYARLIGVKKEGILTAATGIIGLDLPMDIIENALEDTYKEIDNTVESAKKAAEGIITTDTYTKEIAVEINIKGKKVRLGAMAKGSGMIQPNMATVLCFITTDVDISKELLNKALKHSVNETYNMISVDGATSTNDMAMILANKMAGNEKITEEDEFYEKFKNALIYINEKIAKDIVRDGEGATKMFQVNIKNAKTVKDARKLAKSIVSDNLVKTAMFGEDANWGRILAAMGGAGAFFDPKGVYIEFESQKGKIMLMERGEPITFDENIASEILSEQEIAVNINLKDGNSQAKAWGCDLSYEYVRINGDYRSRA